MTTKFGEILEKGKEEEKQISETAEVQEDLIVEEGFYDITEEFPLTLENNLLEQKRVKDKAEKKYCKHCKKLLVNNNNDLCSRQCYTDWRNAHHIVNCDFCQKVFVVPLKNRINYRRKPSSRKFCSRECFFQWSKLERFKNKKK